MMTSKRHVSFSLTADLLLYKITDEKVSSTWSRC